MKILFYTNDLVAGGAERVMSILANNMVRMGHQVTFLLVSPKKQHDIFYPLDNRIQIIGHTHSVRLVNLRASKQLIDILRAEYKSIVPDVVFCFFSFMALYMKLATVGLRAKIIYSLRTDPYSISRKLRYYDKLSAFFSSKMVCQSEVVKQYYPAIIQKKVTVIMNPLEMDKLPTNNKPNSEKEIVAVGRLIPSKNYDMLLDAFSMVADTIVDYNLKIFGEGIMRKHLEEKVRLLHLTGRVFFMGNDPNVLKSIANSSLFVMCSEYEGLPNALIEALCLGLPCISTDYSPGGIHEIITDQENGVIVKRGDVNKLSKEMVRVIKDANFREELSKKAVRLKEKVNSETITQKWINVIK